MIAVIVGMTAPSAFGELYYNNEYSFSVQYPDNWRVTEGTMVADGFVVGISDGVEEGSVYSIWESDTMIYVLTDMGEKLSNQEEKSWWAEESKKYCNESNYNNADYRCGSFKIISQVSGKSLNGYPTITTKYSETRQYSDANVGITPMMVVDKLIYVGDSIWIISTSTDTSKFSEYEDMIYATTNSFRYPASPPIENSSSGGGCLIATATYGSEMSHEVQQLRELRDNQLLNTESGKQFMGMFNDI